jgi:hypothetical protein
MATGRPGHIGLGVLLEHLGALPGGQRPDPPPNPVAVGATQENMETRVARLEARLVNKDDQLEMRKIMMETLQSAAGQTLLGVTTQREIVQNPTLLLRFEAVQTQMQGTAEQVQAFMNWVSEVERERLELATRHGAQLRGMLTPKAPAPPPPPPLGIKSGLPGALLPTRSSLPPLPTQLPNQHPLQAPDLRPLPKVGEKRPAAAVPLAEPSPHPGPRPHPGGMGVTRVPTPGAALPEGWACYRDDRGMYYYHHAATNKTQWEAPPPPRLQMIGGPTATPEPSRTTEAKSK